MQIPESWLRSFANPPLATEELTHLLTMSGLEVEHCAPVAPAFSGVVVAEVLSVERHPNADKLSVCRVEDIALSVAASVIGHQADKGWAITDAGWMALSRDRGTAAQPLDQGYGLVCDADGRPLDGVIVADANQEHGILAHRSGEAARMPRLPVGTLVRILPNHACATGAQHGAYHVVRGSRRIEARWERIGGW